MKIKFSPRAFKYLQEKQASAVTFYQVDIETACCVGAAREVGIALEPPRRQEHYKYQRAEGLDVYVHRDLQVSESVVIKKQGFWKFASLYADGLRISI